MAETPTAPLADDELRNLRHGDEVMERTGVVRAGTRMGWEAAKGAAAGLGASAVVGLPLTVLLPPVGLGILAGGALVGAATNAIWGVAAKNKAVKEDEEALQKAALVGAQQNGQIMPEQAQGLTPKRSPFKGALTAIGIGAGIAGGVALVAGATLLPVLAVAAAAAVAATAINAKLNQRDNEKMETTITKAAVAGGAKERKSRLDSMAQQQRGTEIAPERVNEIGGLSAAETPSVAKPGANPLAKPKKTRG